MFKLVIVSWGKDTLVIADTVKSVFQTCYAIAPMTPDEFRAPLNEHSLSLLVLVLGYLLFGLLEFLHTLARLLEVAIGPTSAWCL